MSGWLPWRILHVHLDREVPPLPAGDGTGGVHAVFWHGDVPLGQRRFRTDELPLSAAALREAGIQEIGPTVLYALSLGTSSEARETEVPGTPAPQVPLAVVTTWQAPLQRLREQHDAAVRNAARLGASVIICTRDRPLALERCLASVTGMLGPHDEAIVVDNAPTSDETHRVAARYARVRYVLEPKPGLDVARNTGIRNSGADLVVFCDDDVEVHPNWLTRMKSPFSEDRVAAVTGLVLPASLETEAENLFEIHWGFNRGCRVRTYGPAYFARLRSSGVPAWEVGAGASMAFRRSVVGLLGGFDERLDVGAAGCSGDSEMWYRILAAGHLCRYEPSAVAFHHHRREMEGLREQLRAYMRGHSAALLVQFERHHHYGNLRRLLLTLPWHYTRRLAKLVLGRDRWQLQTLPDEIRGWLSGIVYYLRAPRQPPPAVVDAKPAGARPAVAGHGDMRVQT